MSDVKLSQYANAMGRLGRLLAQENITVVHGSYSTASFSPARRVLRLPTYRGSMSRAVYNMFVAHEIGHAKHTPVEGWHHADEDIPGVPRALINIVEDIRIEKLVCREYEGLYRDFVAGYADLVRKDWFGVKGRNLGTMGFVNRLNMYAKAGSRGLMDIPFTESEMAIVDQAMLVETWNDVLHMCKVIKEFCEKRERTQENDWKKMIKEAKERFEEEMKENSEFSYEIDDEEFSDDLEEEVEEVSEETDAPGAMESEDEDVDEDEDEDKDKEESDFDDDEDDPLTGTSINENPEKASGEADESDQQSSFEAPDSDEESSSDDDNDNDNRKSGQSGGKEEETHQDSEDEDETELEDDLDFSTDERYRKAEAEASYGSHCSTLRINHKAVDSTIVDFAEASPRAPDLEMYSNFLNTYKRFIMKMVSEFNLRKAAHRQKRVSEAKTGRLDPNKLANYKFSEDIFARYGIQPGEKNHGIVIMVDTSLSMNGYPIRGVLTQMMILGEFCHRVGIPFKVYGWTSLQNDLNNYRENDVLMDNYKATCFFDSTRRGQKYKEQMARLNEVVHTRRSIYMNGTPSGQNVAAMLSICSRFKEEHNIERLHSVFMADDARFTAVQTFSEDKRRYLGGAGYNTNFRIEVNNQVYQIETEAGESMINTKAMIHVLNKICASTTYYAVSRQEWMHGFLSEAQISPKTSKEMIASFKGRGKAFFASANEGLFSNMILLPYYNCKELYGLSNIVNEDEDKYAPGLSIQDKHKMLKKSNRDKKDIKALCTTFAKYVA